MTGQPGQKRGPRGEDWTAEMDAEMVRRMSAGESFSTIGRALGRSRCAAIGRARRMGLSVSREQRMMDHQLRERIKHAPVRKSRQPSGDVLAAMQDRIKARWKVKPAPIRSTAGVPFMALDHTHCRYPVSAGEPWLFCGKSKAAAGGSYCEAHALACRSDKAPANLRRFYA